MLLTWHLFLLLWLVCVDPTRAAPPLFTLTKRSDNYSTCFLGTATVSCTTDSPTNVTLPMAVRVYGVRIDYVSGSGTNDKNTAPPGTFGDAYWGTDIDVYLNGQPASYIVPAYGYDARVNFTYRSGFTVGYKIIGIDVSTWRGGIDLWCKPTLLPAGTQLSIWNSDYYKTDNLGVIVVNWSLIIHSETHTSTETLSWTATRTNIRKLRRSSSDTLMASFSSTVAMPPPPLHTVVGTAAPASLLTTTGAPHINGHNLTHTAVQPIDTGPPTPKAGARSQTMQLLRRKSVTRDVPLSVKSTAAPRHRSTPTRTVPVAMSVVSAKVRATFTIQFLGLDATAAEKEATVAVFGSSFIAGTVLPSMASKAAVFSAMIAAGECATLNGGGVYPRFSQWVLLPAFSHMSTNETANKVTSTLVAMAACLFLVIACVSSPQIVTRRRRAPAQLSDTALFVPLKSPK